MSLGFRSIRKGAAGGPAEGSRRRAGRRVAVLSLVVATGLGAGVATARASSTGWHGASQIEQGKAKFEGRFKWYSRGDNHGGFEIKGALLDLNKTNTRGVKFQVTIEGYAPYVYKAKTDHDRSIPDEIYSTGDQTIVRDASYQTCQRNIITPDDCTDWKHQKNPLH